MPEEDIVRLEPESKHLTDTIKMLAYRAETVLFRALSPAYTRNEDEGRALIREILASNADIIPQPDAKRLIVKVHSMANPRSNTALAHLCQTLNASPICYPGTNLTMVFQPPAPAKTVAKTPLDTAETMTVCQES